MLPEFSSEYVSTDEVVAIIREGGEKRAYTESQPCWTQHQEKFFLIGY